MSGDVEGEVWHDFDWTPPDDPNTVTLHTFTDEQLAAYVAAERGRAVAEALGLVRATTHPVALLTEKTRTQMRKAGDIAASLLNHEDDQVKRAAHDLLHHLAAASRGFTLHDQAMSEYRAALRAALPAEPTGEGT